MANQNRTSAATLPLPPLEWDTQWANTLIRVLNLWIQQTENPGDLGGTNIVIRDREGNIAFSVESGQSVDLNYITMKELPTSATGLSSGQLWRDTGTNILHIVP